MTQQSIVRIIENTALTKSVYRLVLAGDTSAVTAPGQFVNIKLEGLYLRRPLSVCDCEGEKLTLLYKVVGKGTEQLSRLPVGGTLDLLTGLGNGFDVTKCGNAPLLIGGGVGVPPLYLLAKQILRRHVRPTVVMGFNTAEEIFYAEEFLKLGVNLILTTVDGSAGVRGFVTDGMRALSRYSFVYCCGPLPMLKAVYDACETDGEFSFEEHMGCGFGGCMGCSCQTKYGPKRICKEGPVLCKEEIVW